MSLALKIAARYLRSKKTHHAVNVISIVAVCGVAIATAALIVVLSVFNGLRDVIQDKLSKLDPPIAINVSQGKVINNADSVIAVISQVDGVEAVMPVVEEHALAIFNGNQVPVRIKGVPEDYNKMTSIESTLLYGDFILDDDVSQYTILGRGPAEILLQNGYNQLSMINIYVPQRRGKINLNDPESAFRVDSVFIAGIFEVQQKSYDSELIFTSLDLARKLLDYENEATQIEVSLKPGADEGKVMKQLNKALGDVFTVKNRIMQEDTSFKLVNMEKLITTLLLIFIMIIATFNVISALSLLIIEKDESITTFRNLGATRQMITRIFVAQGWLITTIGAVAGVIIGLLLCWGQATFGWVKMSSDASLVIVQAYPVKVMLTDVLLTFVLASLVGLIASVATSLTMKRRLNF
ncbi:MAG: ABC transporter permease [Muribaculaceae bacterium]|nr:ABC transporter permease [Muribaculaceae bacterium]